MLVSPGVDGTFTNRHGSAAGGTPPQTTSLLFSLPSLSYWLAPSPAKVRSECRPALSATRQPPSFWKWPGFAQWCGGYAPECAVHGSAGLVAWLENTQASTTSSSFFHHRHTNDNPPTHLTLDLVSVMPSAGPD